MSDDAIARVHYFERQFLRTQDFTAEQEYHLAMRRRHMIAHHIWGIVAGLTLTVDPDSSLWIEPGMAIDGYGRELILPVRQPLRREEFSEKNTDMLGVWLLYERIGGTQAPPGYAGCGPNGAGLYRWQELARARMDTIDPNFPDMRKPKSVPEGDWEFDPSRVPPDDPLREWPVFLGQIARERPDLSQPTVYTYRVVQAEANRPYAGLVGEAIVAPSGRARMQLGAESRADDRRFALFLQDPQATGALRPRPSLEVGADGAVAVRGTTTVHGDLTIDGGALEFNVGVARSPQARPWQIYQTVDRRPLASGATADAAPQTEETHELRVEMKQSGKGLNKVVIGAWSADDQAFKPCLTVADDCQVTVHGNLIVQGILTELQARPAPKITQQTRALALSATLETINRKIIAPTTSDVEAVVRILSTVDGRRQVVVLLESNESLGPLFFADLLASTPARTAVVTSLLNTSDGRQAVIGGLLSVPGALTTIMRELGAIPAGRSAIGAVLQANEVARTEVLTSLLATGDGRAAVASVLLANTPALTPVVERLAGNAGGQHAIIAALNASATARTAVIEGLLANIDGRTAVASVLLQSNEAFQRVIETLASNAAGRTDIVRILLQTNDGRAVVASELLNNDLARAAMSTQLQGSAVLRDVAHTIIADPNARGTVTDVLLQTSDQAALNDLAARVLDTASGALAVAAGLGNANRFKQFVETLNKPEFAALRADLKAQLT